MGQIVDLNSIKAQKKEVVDKRQLDTSASYVCLEECLKIIEMNSLKELRDLKAMMRRTMKVLSEIK